MSQFNVLMGKELRESWRSFKILWIPLVFILLGVSDPILNYYLMDILKAVGEMPEGFQMVMPELSPADILAASTGQFQSIGLIVLIATFVGTISRERQNGTATLLYVRPISHMALFLSKWLVACLVAVISVIAGYAASLYYTVLLYGPVQWDQFIGMLATYLLWICLIMAVTVAMSAAFKTVIAATLTIIMVIGGTIFESLIGSFLSISPWKLPSSALSLLSDYYDRTNFILNLSLSTGLLIFFIVLGIFMCQRNASTTEI
ncbi:ABC-2 type transport system permease protein [Ureibacillus xyleni]|uniref:ABC-2 type transport system permease protein n=1 Tax=Ureibacillus xyleni TaxID=614648 RepID=A0A285TKW4_9BACL|nr:ABC transporter permease subunit [Ureibacillus xyleni]SOC23165.1 ABC-2 type transport system permease protein [Ureibacillus xyleni]